MRGSRAVGAGGRREEGALRYGPLLAATLIGAAITVVAVASPAIDFAYKNPPLHVAFETAEALIASIVGLVFFGRFRETRLARDLVLVFVLVLFALTNVVFSVIPTVLLQARPDITLAWAPASIRLCAAGLLVVSAFALGDRRSRLSRPAFALTAIAILTVQMVGAVVLALTPHLPNPLGQVLLPQEAGAPLLQGHPVFMVFQATNMVLLGIASLGFARHAAREDDEAMHWIAAGCILAAYARLHYLLFPSLYTEYIYTGDFLRLAFYVLLLVGGVREIQSFWEGRAASAVAEERQRFARDLHDGAAQELLYILALTRRMLKGKGDREDLESLASAADRAVFDSRRAINALSSDSTQTLTEAIQEAAKEIGVKWGGEIETRLEPVSVSPERTEHLVRIAREAMTNAVKHASPTTITVTLASDDSSPGSVVLSVTDDGAGFDVGATRSSKRFGLVSMQERVNVVGGDVTYLSRPGEGTTVRVVFAVTEPATS